jgi:hypothetical protein
VHLTTVDEDGEEAPVRAAVMQGKGQPLAVEEPAEPTPRVVLEPLITDTIGPDELPERFEALKRPTTECKVLIEP